MNMDLIHLAMDQQQHKRVSIIGHCQNPSQFESLVSLGLYLTFAVVQAITSKAL